MKLQNKIKPVRLALVSMLALIFLLSACSTGADTTGNQPANNTSNSANMEGAVSTTDFSNTTTDTQTPTEDSTQSELTEAPADSSTVSFAADVLPILESRCFQCHGGDRTEGKLTLLSYAEIMAGGESGQVVIPGDADTSYLAQLIVDQKMPKRGPKLTPAQTQIILDWINEGALDN